MTPQRHRDNRAEAGLLLLALFLFGLGISLHYGRIGYMPLDQSIVFDGGWRIVTGQLPHRDFHTPYGVTPILLQAIVFRLLGVNWFAYCLHAAVFNGAFCVLVYCVLRTSNLPQLASAFFAALSGVVFYPPFGVPFMDQHAFFFTLLFIALVLGAARVHRVRVENALWLLVAPAFGLALLSKPIPTLLGLPLAVTIWACGARDRTRSALLLAAGAAATLACGGIFAALAGLDVGELWSQLTVRAGDTGWRRLRGLMAGGALLRSVGRVGSAHPPISLGLALGGSTLALVAGIRFALTSDSQTALGERVRALSGVFAPAALSLGLLATGYFYAVMTWNQAENSLGLLYVSVGLALSALLGLRPLLAELEGARRRAQKVGAAGLLALFFGASGFEALVFARDVDATRLVNEGNVARSELPLVQTALPEPLSFLRWRPISRSAYEARDLREIEAFFARNPGNFFLIGDSSILYGITGRPSLNPVLWFHPGMTMPRPNTPAFARYQDDVLARLEAHDARYIVVEGDETWLGVSLADFNLLMSRLPERQHRASFGPFEIFELGPR